MKAAALLLLAAGAAFAGPFDGARFSTVTGAGGVPLNVVETGDPTKPAVLLIHGFRQSTLSWAAQFASELPQRCRLVAFDLRGHGNSGHPWQPEAYDHARPWADDVARVIEALALKKPLVVGWSFGGNVAMDFATLHPEVPVAGYLLVGTAAGTNAAPAPPPAAASAPPRPTASPDLSVNIPAVGASTEFIFRSPRITAEQRAQFSAAAMRVGPWVEQAVARRPRTEAPFVPAQPLVFATGEADPLVGPPVLAKLKTLFPAARFVSFPGAGHAPFIEDPARFNALLDELHCGGR